MTITGWSLVRFAHVMAAIGWVGGQVSLSAVVFPVFRGNLEPAVRAPLMRQTGQRFAWIANVVLLPTLVVTGVALASHRYVRWGDLLDTGYGRLLAFKLVFVAISIGIASVHGVLARNRPSSARPIAIAGLVSSLAIIVFATALVP